MLKYYVKDPDQQAQACVIWMHGLGADASDMIGLVEQLPIRHLSLRHVFLDAPIMPVTLNGGMAMPAWFDIIALDIDAPLDKEGIFKARQGLSAIIKKQVLEGFDASQIYLAGFSQGGALALITALQMEEPLAGVIALSAFLPINEDIPLSLAKNTPIFMAYGSIDPLVAPLWTQMSIQFLEEKGYTSVSSFEYPMPHAICAQEMRDLSHWLEQQVQRHKDDHC